MKRWFLILIAMMVLLTGCSGTEEKPLDLPEDGFDNSGEKIVLYGGKKSFPLSYTIDGKQQIENGTYWYYELEDSFEREWQDPFYTYGVKKLELNGSKEYKKAVKEKCFATNGNWPLFLSPVHAEYSASNQDLAEKGIVDVIKKQLQAHRFEDEKVLLTDTWSCDLDGDGNAETLIKACNCEEEAERYYCILAYLKGDDCQVLYSSFSENEKCSPDELSPSVCDLNGDGKWELLLYRKGDYESFCSFDFADGNFTKGYEIIF